MSIPSDGWARVVCDFTGPLAQQINCVLHGKYDIGVSVDPQDLTDLVGDVFNQIRAPFQAVMDDGMTLANLNVYARNFTTSQWDPVGVFAYNAAGSVVGNILPPQVTHGVRLRTEDVRVVGHVYWPGPNSAMMTSLGTVTTPTQANLLAAFGNLTVGYVRPLGDWLFGVFSTKAVDVVPITSVETDGTFDTQRRRKIEVGS